MGVIYIEIRGKKNKEKKEASELAINELRN